MSSARITPSGVGTAATMACCAVLAIGLVRRMLVSGAVASAATAATASGTIATPIGGSARPLTGQCNVSR